ncbi:MAG: DUF1937 family protein [Promethearchaeota archaeon]
MTNSFCDKLWYLAHPYSADSEDTIEMNVMKASRIAAKLICAGLVVYSPISMTHWIHKEAVSMGLLDKTEWELWIRFDEYFITNCASGVIMAPGWEDSPGCRWEYDLFTELQKPIYLLEEIFLELGIQD